MIQCTFRNETQDEFSEEKIRLCIETLVQRCWPREEISVTIVFVSPDRMQFLNKTYHGEDQPTEVLSFISKDNATYRGEVVLCPDAIRAQNPTNFLWELCHNAIHGVLHLLGQHHEKSLKKHKEIHQLEEEVLSFVLKSS